MSVSWTSFMDKSCSTHDHFAKVVASFGLIRNGGVFDSAWVAVDASCCAHIHIPAHCYLGRIVCVPSFALCPGRSRGRLQWTWSEESHPEWHGCSSQKACKVHDVVSCTEQQHNYMHRDAWFSVLCQTID